MRNGGCDGSDADDVVPDDDDGDGDDDDDDDDEDFLGPEMTIPGCDEREDEDENDVDVDFGVSGSVNPSHCPTRAIICYCRVRGERRGEREGDERREGR